MVGILLVKVWPRLRRGWFTLKDLRVWPTLLISLARGPWGCLQLLELIDDCWRGILTVRKLGLKLLSNRD